MDESSLLDGLFEVDDDLLLDSNCSQSSLEVYNVSEPIPVITEDKTNALSLQGHKDGSLDARLDGSK